MGAMTETGLHEIVLVRHGETEWSEAGKHTSTTDLPLNERGRESAHTLAAKLAGLEFAAVLVSPLRRARETCELAGFADCAEVSDDLFEWRYGVDEGRTTEEIRQDRPGWTVWREGPQGGETAEVVRVRVDSVIEQAVNAAGDTLLFAHGHILRALAARWMGLDVSGGAHLALGTATVSRLGYERDTRVILAWNT
jgi:broad specificity phosphatase PhoE